MPSPIQHVLIVVKENHGFDNYFGAFPGADGDPNLPHSPHPPPRDPNHRHAAWLTRATIARLTCECRFLDTELEKWTDGTQFRYGGRVPCLVVSP